MAKSKVYFTDRNAETYYNMIDKLEHIFNEMGLKDAIEPGEKVMVKTHFGQWGNTNYMRPAYVRKVVELVKAAGGIRSYEDAKKMITAGATRIGASAGIKILQEAKDVTITQ